MTVDNTGMTEVINELRGMHGFPGVHMLPQHNLLYIYFLLYIDSFVIQSPG